MAPRSRQLLWILGRALGLALATALCAAISALGGLVAFESTLPPTDGAYGMSLWEWLQDPVVAVALVLYAATAGALAYPFALALLLRTRLRLTIPLVSGTVILATTAACAILHPVEAAVVGLLVGAAAMLWCRLHFALAPPA